MSGSEQALWTLANVGLLIANIGVFGLGLKLYTEFFKQAAQMNRGKRDALPRLHEDSR